LKEIAIYICLVIVMFPYNFIYAFSSDVARAKDIPGWFIGIVFSLNPAVGLFVTLGLGK
jgi:hypothetical protein